MDIRPLTPQDLPVLLELTIDTFEPFYEHSFRPLVGDIVFTNRHGNWREDYRRHLAGLHAPEDGRYAAIAEDDERIVGFIGWVLQPAERHGEIDLLAVTADSRRRGVGRALVEHAIAHLKTGGAEVVSIGTGGDDFYAPARALYEELGFTPFPNVNYTKAI